MRILTQALAFGLITLFSATPLLAADIYYDTNVKYYVRGGIKPGPLYRANTWVTIVPNLIAQNHGMQLHLDATDNKTGKVQTFGYASCGVGNFSAQPAGMPITYWGNSCNFGKSPNGPDTNPIMVPENSKISVGSTATYETKKGSPGATTPIRALFVSSRSTWKSCGDAKVELAGHLPSNNRKHLEVHAYVIPNTGPKIGDTGFISRRTICIAVVPRGADINSASVTGAVYALNNARETYLGTFVFVDDNPDAVTSKNEVALFSDSNADQTKFPTGNKHPTVGDPEFSNVQYNGKLIVKLSVKFSNSSTTQVFDQVGQPVLTYPPKNLR